MHLMAPFLKFVSTNLHCSLLSPALWNATPLFTQALSRLPTVVGSPWSSMMRSAPSTAPSGMTSFISGASLVARVSVDLRVFTNTRHCPPSRMASLTSAHMTSFSFGMMRLELSVKYTVPSR